MQQGGSSDSAEGRRGWCVLLCRAGDGVEASPPKDLMATLSRKGLVVRVCRSVYQAMAELVVHEMQVRADETRSPMILMVVEPDDIRGSKDLVRAAEKYASHSACWRYTRRSKPKLAAFRVEEQKQTSDVARSARDVPVGPALRGSEGAKITSSLTGAFEAIKSRTVRTAKASKPRLRLAGDGPTPPPAAAPAPVTPPGAPAPIAPSAPAPVAPAREAPKRTPEGIPAGFEDGPIEPEIVIGEPMPLDSKPMEGRPAPSRKSRSEPELPTVQDSAPGEGGPLLSDEELAILLWDTWYPEQQEG